MFNVKEKQFCEWLSISCWNATDPHLIIEQICHSGLKGQEQFFALPKQVIRQG